MNLTPNIARTEYENGESVITIAEKYNTYPKKVERMLKSIGVKFRTRSESQKLAIQKGRHNVSINHSEESRLKISASLKNYYDNLEKEQKEEIGKRAKEHWDNRTVEDKKDFNSKSAKGRLRAARNGSKLERYIYERLNEEGYKCRIHPKNFLANQNLQVDLLVEEKFARIAIEIDGPSHYIPMWGEDKLRKQQSSDREKNGLLITAGYVVVRLKNLHKNLSKFYQEWALEQVKQVIGNIKENGLPEPSQRLIYIEENDERSE